MEQHKRVIPIFLLAAVVVVSMLLLRTPAPEPSPPVISVRTAVISADTPKELLQIPGTTRSADTAQLRFQVNGRVTEILVALGDKVEKGSVLARLYNPEIEPRARQAAENLARLEAENQQAERDFERLDALYKEQAVTLQEWETGRTRLQTTKTAKDAAQAELERAEQISSELALVAPFAGSVTDILVDVGEVVAIGNPAVRLTNPNAVELKIPLSESVLNQLELGQEVDVIQALRPNEPALKGQIIEISPFRERGSLPEIIIALDATEIRPGTAVNAVIEVAAQNTLSLPLRSVLMTGNQTTAVYRVQDQVANLVAIRPLRITANSVLIDTQLAAGDEIVTEGIAQLYDGAKVVIAPETEAE